MTYKKYVSTATFICFLLSLKKHCYSSRWSKKNSQLVRLWRFFCWHTLHFVLKDEIQKCRDVEAEQKIFLSSQSHDYHTSRNRFWEMSFSKKWYKKQEKNKSADLTCYICATFIPKNKIWKTSACKMRRKIASAHILHCSTKCIVRQQKKTRDGRVENFSCFTEKNNNALLETKESRLFHFGSSEKKKRLKK